MGIGLTHASIRTILEDALRHNENPSTADLIEAISTAIVENNKAIEKNVGKTVSSDLINGLKRSGMQI